MARDTPPETLLAKDKHKYKHLPQPSPDNCTSEKFLYKIQHSYMNAMMVLMVRYEKCKQPSLAPS